MGISKRTRYEVLKRDNHACRYCGGIAPDVKLHVDHVIPKSLGGTDKPDNLVAACKDCNLGKSSTSPDDALVAEVEARSFKWREAIQQAAVEMVSDLQTRNDLFTQFLGIWESGYNEVVGPLPPDWRSAITMFTNMGLPFEAIEESIDIAATKKLPDASRFRYFCGVCRNKIEALNDRARELVGDAPTRKCGHCEYCQEATGEYPLEDSYCLAYSTLDHNEERIVCSVCGSPTCMYEYGFIAGDENGKVDTYNRFQYVFDHYRNCPEVKRG